MQIKTFREAEQKIIETVQEIKQHSSLKPPFRYHGLNDPISKILDFEIKEKKLHSEYGLYLTKSPDTEKPTIVIDTNGSDEERLNFTYFHEVTHHIIRLNNELYAFIDELATQNEDLRTLKERLANIGAAEFLLPGKDIKETINKNGFSIKLLLELDKQYPASKPAITIQLARQAVHKCFAVVCEFGPVPTKNPIQSELIKQEKTSDINYLHIRYATNSPTNKYSIGSYTRIPKNHLLNDIFENKLPFAKRKDIIPFRSGKEWPVSCEGIFYKGKVYGVFNIDSPPPPTSLQPELFKLPN